MKFLIQFYHPSGKQINEFVFEKPKYVTKISQQVTTAPVENFNVFSHTHPNPTIIFLEGFVYKKPKKLKENNFLNQCFEQINLIPENQNIFLHLYKTNKLIDLQVISNFGTELNKNMMFTDLTTTTIDSSKLFVKIELQQVNLVKETGKTIMGYKGSIWNRY